MNGTVGAIASDYAALIRPTYVQVVSSVARPINPACSRNGFTGSDQNGTCLSAFVREYGTWIMKDAISSPYVAQRNAGEAAKTCRRFLDFAALHPGYIPWLSRDRDLSKCHSGPTLRLPRVNGLFNSKLSGIVSTKLRMRSSSAPRVLLSRQKCEACHACMIVMRVFGPCFESMHTKRAKVLLRVTMALVQGTVQASQGSRCT